jgi:hypothetical protein
MVALISFWVGNYAGPRQIKGTSRLDTLQYAPKDTLFVRFDPPQITPGDTTNIVFQQRIAGEIYDGYLFSDIGNGGDIFSICEW